MLSKCGVGAERSFVIWPKHGRLAVGRSELSEWRCELLDGDSSGPHLAVPYLNPGDARRASPRKGLAALFKRTRMFAGRAQPGLPNRQGWAQAFYEQYGRENVADAVTRFLQVRWQLHAKCHDLPDLQLD